MLLTLLLGILISCKPKVDIIPVSKHFNLEKLADGVYAAIANPDGGFAICNAGIIDLGDKTVVLDPFVSPIAARDLKQLAEFLTGKPVSIVLNLDPHNDHNGGNQVFVPEADIVGTPNTRKYINDNFKTDYEYYKENAPKKLLEIQKQLKVASGKEKAELILWQSEYQAIIESLPELKMTLPNIVINDTMIIYGSKRRIVVIPTGTGHTNGDMVAWLPVDKIIFMSDQLFVQAHPYLGDGDPESLKNNLKSIIALNPDIAVPGHGPVGDVNSLHVMVDYIETLTDMVMAEIQKGTVENKVLELPMPEKYNDWVVISFYITN
jgi:glyoxylase-like metal-dependent hydrolase (beta-lactamase superfamily II)